MIKVVPEKDVRGDRKESATKRSTFNIDEKRSVSPEVDEDNTKAQNRGENTSQRIVDDCH